MKKHIVESSDKDGLGEEVEDGDKEKCIKDSSRKARRAAMKMRRRGCKDASC